KRNFSNHLFFSIITFTIVCLAWIFFRANTLSDAYVILSGIFNDFHYADIFDKNTYLIGLKNNEFKVICWSILFLFSAEILHKQNNLIKLLNQQAIVFRWAFYLVFVFAIIIFGIYGDRSIKEFIYFQF